MNYAQEKVAKRFGTNKHYNSALLIESGLESINQYKNKFTISNSATYDAFEPRPEQRYRHLAKYHRSFLVGKVIDIGSRSSELLERLTQVKASLVDKHNKDLPDWDWEKDNVPAADSSYDTVICYDTLEHIDNFHEGFTDILRLSKK